MARRHVRKEGGIFRQGGNPAARRIGQDIGQTVGILQQEPPLNEEKTVLGNVEEGKLADIAATKPMKKRIRKRPVLSGRGYANLN